jgi:hypothetical protein
VECIQNILHKHGDIGTNLDKCNIFLLSDRNVTLESLREWILHHTGCRPIIADHILESGLFAEHGPFATMGFFQDLALAAHANGGYIGAMDFASSSADLVRELYEYNRYVLNHSLMRKQNTSLPALHCSIPRYKG